VSSGASRDVGVYVNGGIRGAGPVAGGLRGELASLCDAKSQRIALRALPRKRPRDPSLLQCELASLCDAKSQHARAAASTGERAGGNAERKPVVNGAWTR